LVLGIESHPVFASAGGKKQQPDGNDATTSTESVVSGTSLARQIEEEEALLEKEAERSKSPSDNGDGPSEKSPRRPFQSKLQEEPVADGQEVVDVDLQENKLEKAKRGLKELKEEVEKLEEKRDVAFKASKDTNDTDDKAHYQKQIASAEKQIASAEEGREVQQLLVNAITEKMTSEVQGIGESRGSLMHHEC